MITGMYIGWPDSRPCVPGSGIMNVKGLLPSVAFPLPRCYSSLFAFPAPAQYSGRHGKMGEQAGTQGYAILCQVIESNGLVFYIFKPQNNLIKWVLMNYYPHFTDEKIESQRN